MLTPLGQMREPVQILSPVRTVDNSGGEVITYTASNPLFLALRSTNSKEGVQFGQINSDVSHVAFGHWAELNGLTSRHRIRLVEDIDTEFDIDGGPINSPKRDWSRLNLVLRSNG